MEYFEIEKVDFDKMKSCKFDIWENGNLEIENVRIGNWKSEARESPTPLNIPIPIPASDQGGPVACIGQYIRSCIFRVSKFLLVV